MGDQVAFSGPFRRINCFDRLQEIRSVNRTRSVFPLYLALERKARLRTHLRLCREVQRNRAHLIRNRNERRTPSTGALPGPPYLPGPKIRRSECPLHATLPLLTCMDLGRAFQLLSLSFNTTPLTSYFKAPKAQQNSGLQSFCRDFCVRRRIAHLFKIRARRKLNDTLRRSRWGVHRAGSRLFQK